MCACPRNTHPTQPTKVCVCAYSWECLQVQGMLPSPPHPPTQPTKVCVCAYSWECMQVQGMLPSPPHPPTHPTQRYVCVCAYSWECMQVQRMLPSPAHPPAHPTKVCVCVCVQLGMYASPRYVTIPSPPTHPTQRYVWGMYASPRYVTIPTPPTHPPPTQPKGMCVQMSPQKHVVCTDESDLCAQMRLWECVYRWVKSVCADESPTPGMYKKPCEQWIN